MKKNKKIHILSSSPPHAALGPSRVYSTQPSSPAWEREELSFNTFKIPSSLLSLLLLTRAHRDFIHVSDDDDVVCVRTLQDFRVQGLGFSLAMTTRRFACAPCKHYITTHSTALLHMVMCSNVVLCVVMWYYA